MSALVIVLSLVRDPAYIRRNYSQFQCLNGITTTRNITNMLRKNYNILFLTLYLCITISHFNGRNFNVKKFSIGRKTSQNTSVFARDVRE